MIEKMFPRNFLTHIYGINLQLSSITKIIVDKIFSIYRLGLFMYRFHWFSAQDNTTKIIGSLNFVKLSYIRTDIYVIMPIRATYFQKQTIFLSEIYEENDRTEQNMNGQTVDCQASTSPAIVIISSFTYCTFHLYLYFITNQNKIQDLIHVYKSIFGSSKSTYISEC